MRRQRSSLASHRFTLGKATGRSMSPTLQPGDIIIVERQVRVVCAGDLLVFGDVVHRLVWVDPFERLWECGDAKGSVARRRYKREVTGRVKAVVRDGVFIEVAARHVPRASRLSLVRRLIEGSIRRWRRRC